MHVIVKERPIGDAVGRVPGGLLLGIYQGDALFSGKPPNDLVEMRIGTEPKRVQLAGEAEMGGSGITLTEGQLANRLPESQFAILRINPAGVLVSSQGLRKPASILGLSPAAKALVPFVELSSA